jgi:hypothetical protein
MALDVNQEPAEKCSMKRPKVENLVTQPLHMMKYFILCTIGFTRKVDSQDYVGVVNRA